MYDFLNIEKIEEIYFNADALIIQPEPIYRLKKGSDRFYYQFDDNGEPVFFTSVTTMIKQTLPTSPYLIEWIAQNGYERSKEIAEERAHYGTFMHIEISELLINQTYDLEKLPEKLKNYIEVEKLPSKLINWADDLKKDILAFAQFMIDFEIKPLAIEIMLADKENGYAGAIDLVCELVVEEKGYFGEVYKSGVNKGEPKLTKKQRKVRVIIDLKSGRKGFYESSEIQLEAYRQMWNKKFPDYQVDFVYNWSPKDYRTETPTYNFKDQTNSKNAQKLKHLIELAAIEQEKRLNNVVVTNGVIDLKKGLTNNIMSVNLSDIVKKARDNESPEVKNDILD